MSTDFDETSVIAALKREYLDADVAAHTVVIPRRRTRKVVPRLAFGIACLVGVGVLFASPYGPNPTDAPVSAADRAVVAEGGSMKAFDAASNPCVPIGGGRFYANDSEAGWATPFAAVVAHRPAAAKDSLRLYGAESDGTAVVVEFNSDGTAVREYQTTRLGEEWYISGVQSCR